MNDGDNVLVLLLDEKPDLHALRSALARERDPTVRIVAPAHVGPLHWYSTDEEEEHADADTRARRAARAVRPGEDVEAGSGEIDPVVAVEDALSEFRADRIVVVGEEDGALDESLRRFAIPVERLGPRPEKTRADDLAETGRAIMSGRSGATPYAVLVGAMLVLGLVVAIGFLIAALVLWV